MRFLTGDINYLDYGGSWVSKKLNNGEFDYWLVLELTNMHDATGDENQPKYNLALSCVSPDQAGPENLKRALDGCSICEDEITDLMKVEALCSYGIKAHLWQENGNNFRKLWKAAKHEIFGAGILFGFYMDRAVNRIGTTGWEALKGDITAGLSRTIASGSPEGNILATMHGVKKAQERLHEKENT